MGNSTWHAWSCPWTPGGELLYIFLNLVLSIYLIFYPDYQPLSFDCWSMLWANDTCVIWKSHYEEDSVECSQAVWVGLATCCWCQGHHWHAFAFHLHFWAFTEVFHRMLIQSIKLSHQIEYQPFGRFFSWWKNFWWAEKGSATTLPSPSTAVPLTMQSKSSKNIIVSLTMYLWFSCLSVSKYFTTSVGTKLNIMRSLTSILWHRLHQSQVGRGGGAANWDWGWQWGCHKLAGGSPETSREQGTKLHQSVSRGFTNTSIHLKDGRILEACTPQNSCPPHHSVIFTSPHSSCSFHYGMIFPHSHHFAHRPHHLSWPSSLPLYVSTLSPTR